MAGIDCQCYVMGMKERWRVNRHQVDFGATECLNQGRFTSGYHVDHFASGALKCPGDDP